MLISGIIGLVFISTAIVGAYLVGMTATLIKGRQLTANRVPALLSLSVPICIAWGLGAYFAFEKETKYYGMTTVEIHEANAKWAEACVPYYEMNVFQREIFLREDQWCKAFPEIGNRTIATASVDAEATGSTKESANGLWK
ncbi:hypothetical protein HFO91_30290 [Rhizobium leguminosarum]|uniref:hypothetical protein n=1 Tax=Rhizobium leguminosarum TaxID=384 RepID=UPI001C93A39C|nr:hypothetical protein [Rhizobium leguminosarum]MBY5453869.1 hypothetical protein [Rhizobium leguminosarum]